MAELRPGMRTAWLDDSAWLHEPGLYVGAPSRLTDEDIARIIAEGFREACVVLDDGQDAEQTIAMARKTYLEALKTASQVVMDAAQGRPVDAGAVCGCVKTMLRSVERDADALACVARLTPVEAYLGSHMVNVSALSMAYARTLSLGENELLHLGQAAFLHDIGMTRLPLSVLVGKGVLSGTDERELRRHTLYGAQMLRHVKGVTKDMRTAILQHHEHFDGSGYPGGIRHRQIALWARIIHLADVYDGLMRDSGRGRARTPSRALSHIFSLAGAQFDGGDVERFVRCMTVYPAGSLVRLSSGEAALVVRTSQTTPTTPLVKVVLDERGRIVPPRLIDLATGELAVDEAMDPGMRMADIAALAFAS